MVGALRPPFTEWELGPESHSSLPGQMLQRKVLLHTPWAGPTAPGGPVTSYPTQPGHHPQQRPYEIPGRAIAGARVPIPAVGPAPSHAQALRPAALILPGPPWPCGCPHPEVQLPPSHLYHQIVTFHIQVWCQLRRHWKHLVCPLLSQRGCGSGFWAFAS